jgi:hypothetical protein
VVNLNEEWSHKGATLSDKTVRKEFGLTQEEIVAAIEAGQLQYRVSSMHGNPWLRLLRREVEDLMATTHNDAAHRQKRAKAELLRINKELRHLRSQVAALENNANNLSAELDGS